MLESPGATSPRESIYLVGTSGHPNYGDEFIAAAWLRFLATARPEADVWLDCPQPAMATHLFSGLHPRLRTTNSLWRLVWETTDMPREEADELLAHRIAHLGTPRFDLGLLEARRASVVHLIGGGHINTHWPHHVGLLRVAQALKELTGVQLAASGLGLTPVTGVETLAEAWKSFDQATVRDAPSAEVVSGTLAPDDAFLSVTELAGFARPAGSEPGEVWVCLQHDMNDEGVFDAAVEAVRAALTGPELAGRPVRYLEALPGVDRIAFDRLSDLIPEEGFVPFIRLWEEGFPGRADQTWITSRFHLHLLAAACGAEGTALQVSDDYYRVKHQSLVDLGTGWSVTTPGSTAIEAPSRAEDFPQRARRLSQDKWREALAIYPRKRRSSATGS